MVEVGPPPYDQSIFPNPEINYLSSKFKTESDVHTEAHNKILHWALGREKWMIGYGDGDGDGDVMILPPKSFFYFLLLFYFIRLSSQFLYIL